MRKMISLLTDPSGDGKTCFKCQRTLPRSEFYKHPMMGDGLLGKCKECARADVTANRRAKIDYYRSYDVKRFREDPKRRADTYRTSHELAEKYPDRQKARTAVGNAIRDGRLIRRPCEVCGIAKSEAHHDDYSKPLDVRWLCRRHHEEHHHRTHVA